MRLPRALALLLAFSLLPPLAGRGAAEAAAPGAGANGEAGEERNTKDPPDFQPMPDRWRIEPPPYELNVQGRWWDPYNQNVLKGDYPILGQDIFLRMTGISKTSVEGRSGPTASAVSTRDAGEFPFFGNPDAVIVDQKWGLKLEMQRGSTSFRPFDWQFVFLGVVDLNYLGVYENNAVSPDVRDGTTRLTDDAAVQELAVEVHLADLSANYDFLSAKVGRQPFNSDFRGLIFFDTNQGARLFGSAGGNRYQYNLIYFYMAEKDTNSELNTFDLRDQQVAVANLYVQDLLFSGWQNQFSLTWNFDDGKQAGLVFDRQGFLVRPDPVGVATPHNVNVFYLGWTSEGHIDWLNVSHAFYQALGRDGMNPIAGRAVDINGQMAFLELSVDRDWMRYQASAFYSSGDGDPRDGRATGFDSILDEPRIMGGDFGYWNRQTLRIADRGGVGLMQRKSVIPDLRSSKLQGQANFVNPGILMLNVGATAEVTQTLRAVGNVTYLRFNQTESLELLLKQPNIRQDIGFDFSLGLEYRPFLNNNLAIKGFGAVLEPLGGFRDIYQSRTLFQVGTEILLLF
jgi:hypothetical protein